jgi:chorismate mutase
MEGPTFYTPADIEIIFKKNEPKFISLQDSSGKYVILKNNKSITVADRFKEIKKALNGTSMPPGIYYYCEQNTVREKGAVNKYPVKIGNPSVITMAEPAPVPSVWSHDKALDILSEKNRLELENQFLKNQIADLEAQIDELEDEIKDIEDKTLADGSAAAPAAGPWDKIMTLATPLIEKMMQQQDKRLQLMEDMVKTKQSHAMRGDESFNPAAMSEQQIIDHLQKLINEGNSTKLAADLAKIAPINAALHDNLRQQIYGGASADSGI